jgi:hypothetical protein
LRDYQIFLIQNKMKEITIKITFDDTKGYKGHGDDVPELIKNGIENFMQIDLEGDGVIKNDWTVEIIDKK